MWPCEYQRSNARVLQPRVVIILIIVSFVHVLRFCGDWYRVLPIQKSLLRPIKFLQSCASVVRYAEEKRRFGRVGMSLKSQVQESRHESEILSMYIQWIDTLYRRVDSISWRGKNTHRIDPVRLPRDCVPSQSGEEEVDKKRSAEWIRRVPLRHEPSVGSVWAWLGTDDTC